MSVVIIKRTGGFQAQVNVDGFRRARTFDKKIDAKQWGIETEARLKDSPVTRASFDQAIDAYLSEALPRLSATTQKDHRTRLGAIRERLGRYPIEDVTPKRLHSYLQGLDCQDPTRNRYRSILSAVFKFAMQTPHEMTRHNPVDQVPRYSENQRRERVMSEIEVSRLISAADEIALEVQDQKGFEGAKALPMFLRFLNETGCRRLEALTLSMDRVGLNGICHVQAKNKDRKTGKPELRAVLVSDDLLEMIQSFERRESTFVFPGRWARQHSAIDSAWRECRSRAGIEDVGLHTFRHTSITRVGRNGASIHQLQTFSGHKTPQMVFRYLHTDDDVLRQAAALNN